MRSNLIVVLFAVSLLKACSSAPTPARQAASSDGQAEKDYCLLENAEKVQASIKAELLRLKLTHFGQSDSSELSVKENPKLYQVAGMGDGGWYAGEGVLVFETNIAELGILEDYHFFVKINYSTSYFDPDADEPTELSCVDRPGAQGLTEVHRVHSAEVIRLK